jgi:hypothetical protein
MKLSRYGKVLLLKVLSVFLLLFLLIWYLFLKDDRKPLFSYYDTRCLNYKQSDFSRKLNDRIVDYSSAARLRGVSPSRNDKELKEKIREGRLVLVKTNSAYVVDRMTYSYPCITVNGKNLLEEISERLRDKAAKQGLKGVRIIVTSMTRKTESIKNLRRNNRNASANSPHMYGNAFDISYKRFIVRKWVLTNCDKKFLKDALGEVIWDLREENRCWATFERGQSCFHVVSR